MWCNLGKSVWSRTGDIFSFLFDSSAHLERYILLETPPESDQWFQSYEQLKDCQNNKKHKRNLFPFLAISHNQCSEAEGLGGGFGGNGPSWFFTWRTNKHFFLDLIIWSLRFSWSFLVFDLPFPTRLENCKPLRNGTLTIRFSIPVAYNGPWLAADATYNAGAMNEIASYAMLSPPPQEFHNTYLSKVYFKNPMIWLQCIET